MSPKTTDVDITEWTGRNPGKKRYYDALMRTVEPYITLRNVLEMIRTTGDSRYFYSTVDLMINTSQFMPEICSSIDSLPVESEPQQAL